METIVASAIIGVVTLIGVLIANDKTSAVMETKIEELTREVREHNKFAQRVPVLETRVESPEKEVEELSGYHKPA